MSKFIPTLYIGIGAQSNYYTLRETYLYEQWVGGQGGYMAKEIRSYHHKNLSQNLNEAIAKATEYSEFYGVELRVNKQDLEQEMNEIRRATAEQLARRKEEEANWKAEREAFYEQQKQERLTLQHQQISEGKFPFGPYANKPFTDAPVSYVNWFMKSEFEEGTIIHKVKLALLEKHINLLLPEPDKDKLVGEPGKRLAFVATVVKQAHFDRIGFNGWTIERVFVTTMVTNNSECLVVFSTAFYPEVGDTIKFKATVKEHSEYNGQAQTIIQRVTVVK